MHIEKLLDYMERIPGWMSREEARLLQTSALDALMTLDAANVVEVGAYCGKATVMLADAVRNAQRGMVYAIDPDESLISGVPDAWTGIGKLAIFEEKLRGANLDRTVTLLRKKPCDVEWTLPIAFLHIDGLHDIHNVTSDFNKFFTHVEKGGYVAFHDYGNPGCPDVKRFVDGLLEGGKVSKVASEFHLIVVAKRIE